MPRDTIPALRKLSLVYTQRSFPQFVRKYVVCSGILIHVHMHITACSRCNSHVNAHVYGEHCRFSKKKSPSSATLLINNVIPHRAELNVLSS